MKLPSVNPIFVVLMFITINWLYFIVMPEGKYISEVAIGPRNDEDLSGLN